MGFCVGAEAKEDMPIHLGAALHPADITGQDRSNSAVWGTWILQLTTGPWREFKRTFLFNQVQPEALFFFLFFWKSSFKNVTEVQIHYKLLVCVCV